MAGIKTAALFIDNISGLSRKEKLKILKLLETDRDIRTIDAADTGKLLKGYLSLDSSKIQTAADAVKKITDTCERLGIQIITWFDNSYPQLLKDIYDPPAVLYVRGSVPENMLSAIAVVGTRRATGKALKAAYDTGFILGSEQTVVVSGLAAGVDAEAHKGCIDSGGVTAAVLGNGLDFIYPGSNRKLASCIIEEGGMLISEYPPGTPPLKYHFPERNRIINGLSCAVILVQAPVKSGALITANYALESGRDVYVHQDGLFSVQGAGGKELADNGAEIITLSMDNSCRITSSSSFGNPALIEDEIFGRVFNNKGILYRRKVYA